MVKYKKKLPGLEVPFQKAEYKERDIEDLYELEPRRDERPIFEERPEPEERIVREVKVKREAMPRMEERKIQPLKLLGNDVIGSLFDRVEFLKKRIDEITENLKLRETIHNDMLAEIDVDIREKDGMASKVADIDEKRNIKLDISILRKEKRLEQVQYWRDVTELSTELRELMEKWETETKIMDIFKDITPQPAAVPEKGGD